MMQLTAENYILIAENERFADKNRPKDGPRRCRQTGGFSGKKQRIRSQAR